MPRHLLATILLLGGAGAAPASPQGTLASRIAAAPDGVVRLTYDARPGTCGDGRDLVAYRRALFTNSIESCGGWHDAHCVAGPLRVTLAIANHRPARVTTQVGGTWPSGSGAVTDLGIVSTREAAAWFLAQVPTLERADRHSRVLLPAALAAGADVIPTLFALARDEARTDDTRRQALIWVGQLGDASVVPALVAMARSGASGDTVTATHDEEGDGERDTRGATGVASAALAALAALPEGAGVNALIDLARTGSMSLRHDAVFWLGQTGDARAMRALHAVIERPSEHEGVRANAIFALAHGDHVGTSEFAWLRGIFPRLESMRLKESVLQGMAEDAEAGASWLLARARDPHEAMAVRRAALFWAGQRSATPTRELVAAYRELGDSGLREHAIFVLSQRDDDAAVDALLDIARTDADRRMRQRALFWLAQKDDPRVTNLISAILAP